MTDMDLAVRCLSIVTEVTDREVELLDLRAKVAERDDDDDSARLARIAVLNDEIEALRAEQTDCAGRIKTQPDLAEVMIAHAALNADHV